MAVNPTPLQPAPNLQSPLATSPIPFFGIWDERSESIEAQFRDYETDFANATTEHPEDSEYWTESRRHIQYTIQALRNKLDQVAENPEMWERLAPGIEEGLETLRTEYESTIRPVQR